MLKGILKVFQAPMSPYIKIAEHGSVGVVTLDRPSSMNAINNEMYK